VAKRFINDFLMRQVLRG